MLAAALGLVLTGIGVGAMFPLASAMHVGASPRGADAAIGQVFAAASIGQISGPLLVGVMAQAWGLRVALLAAPALALLALGALTRD